MFMCKRERDEDGKQDRASMHVCERERETEMARVLPCVRVMRAHVALRVCKLVQLYVCEQQTTVERKTRPECGPSQPLHRLKGSSNPVLTW